MCSVLSVRYHATEKTTIIIVVVIISRTVSGFKDDGGCREGRRGQGRAVDCVHLHLNREGRLSVKHILRGDVRFVQSVSDVVPAGQSYASSLSLKILYKRHSYLQDSYSENSLKSSYLQDRVILLHCP